MSDYFKIHPDNPQLRLVRLAVATVREGGILVYPTDSGYALGCRMGDKKALDRIRALRQLDQAHPFSLMCRDLSELSTYAHLSNPSYRLLKSHTPGAYTFILKATRELPRRLADPKRKTIGIRVPDNVIALAILEELRQPMMSTTLKLPGQSVLLIEPEVMRDVLGSHVDAIVDGGFCGLTQTTVVDLTGTDPVIVRQGQGTTDQFV